MVTDGDFAYRGERFRMCTIVRSLNGTPETNTVLSVSRNSMKQFLKDPVEVCFGVRFAFFLKDRRTV